MIPTLPEPATPDPGTEEGETCNRDGCTGKLELPTAEDCSCHINPPCSACLAVVPTCPDCGWSPEDET